MLCFGPVELRKLDLFNPHDAQSRALSPCAHCAADAALQDPGPASAKGTRAPQGTRPSIGTPERSMLRSEGEVSTHGVESGLRQRSEMTAAHLFDGTRCAECNETGIRVSLMMDVAIRKDRIEDCASGGNPSKPASRATRPSMPGAHACSHGRAFLGTFRGRDAWPRNLPRRRSGGERLRCSPWGGFSPLHRSG